ncbi:hypothetical protein D9Q98_010400 [Chlorella vulgaris]|uniref:Prefoldin subunit 6 n=1 Tax=Chlorella vulgaris TaxID=3077 RepID=A0A9D4TRK3_CHLVU|nr:hypothetical protein D9Q98_010400 [Chlorella vulgaris]
MADEVGFFPPKGRARHLDQLAIAFGCLPFCLLDDGSHAAELLLELMQQLLVNVAAQRQAASRLTKGSTCIMPSHHASSSPSCGFQIATMQQAVQEATAAFQATQQDVAQNHSLRRNCLQQQHENEMVLQELKLLAADAIVYKMIGPVLVRQDTMEARSNVSKRLEFIAGEVKRLDTQLQQLEEKQSTKQAQLVKMQQEVQGQQQHQQQGVTA